MILTCPFAHQSPGPSSKTWGMVNTFEGVICHSAEGGEIGMWTVLNGAPAASWHFSVMADGRIYQHYRLDQSPWHAGSKAQNLRLVGIEHEGVRGEPLTPAQLASSVRLVRWIAEQGGWRMERGVTLLEHREVYQTSCPSGRIPWEHYLVQPQGEFYPEEEEMAVTKLSGPEAIDAFMRAVGQVSPAIAQQEGRYVGTVDAGEYLDVVIRTRKGA